jgi:hypothetical protein
MHISVYVEYKYSLWYNFTQEVVMPRLKENRERITTNVDKDLLKKIREYSIKTGIPTSKIFDKSLLMYIEEIIDKKG